MFAVKGQAGKHALERWLSWVRRCRIPAFVHLAKRITAVQERINATLDHELSNALIESVNTKIRLLTRIAFGFRSATALIGEVVTPPAEDNHRHAARARRRPCPGGAWPALDGWRAAP